MYSVETRNANYPEPLDLAVDQMLEQLRAHRSRLDRAIRKFETRLQNRRTRVSRTPARCKRAAVN
ncbi:hypothetical protein SBA3_2650012 [Candidatus Sulfopaludibacter sp. SbA3]|nr:hypothetical protein SBA3_2650012 [Candidatus Sulfopaludibacter sp. SbA3]